MWPLNVRTVWCSLLVVVYVVTDFVLADVGATEQFCTEKSITTDESIFTCSCPSVTDTLIVQDKNISYENRHINIPDNTQHWRIGGCSTVHLSGPTLTSLNNIHTLHLHDIDHVHLAYDFFTQYNSPLQILRLSHCTFDTLQGSLNIHAHKLKNISLEKMNWNDQIDILIQTQEGQQLDLVAIRNSNIKVLGEINLSSRYVHTFVLENNNIGSINTGAIIQDSHETIIQGNYIGALNFLSMDTDTYNFTLQGNTIKSLALESLVVNSAILLQVNNNSFFHIERLGLTWLRSKYDQGTFVFSSNHFYEHGRGSLIFYFTIFNEKLKMQNNMLHTTHCTCNTLKYIEEMTEMNERTLNSFIQERKDTYKLFMHSSFCLDKNGKSHLSSLCKTSEVNHHYWKISVAVIIVIIIIGFLVLAVKTHKGHRKYARLTVKT